MKYLTGLSRTCISAATCLLLLQGFAPEARAESTVDGYSHIVKQAEAVAPLGPNLFGDSVNMMNGATEFHVTDVSVPSNVNIPVSVGRVLRVDSETTDQQSRMAQEGTSSFGFFWALDVPVMYGTFDARYGWAGGSVTGQIGAPQNPARCTQASNGPPPVDGVGPFYSVVYNTRDYFSGITINVPGSGSEQFLHFSTPSKAIGGKTYYGTTRSNWLIGCTPSLANPSGSNGQGEGFLVTLPNGTTYQFDWMASRAATYVIDDVCGSTPDILPSAEGLDAGVARHFTCQTSVAVPRNQVFLYATKATDRFGNTVTYTYDPANPEHLTQIKASDGAEIDLTYGSNNLVQTVTAGGHTWTYAYGGTYPAIQSVTLPDLSKWSYDYGSNIYGVTKYNARNVWAGCHINIGTKTTDLAAGPYESNTITMTSPSGATGTFDFRQILHGTRAAEPGCTLVSADGGWSPNPNIPHVTNPSDYQTASLVRKTISGLGLTTQQWTYSYKPSWTAPYQSETTVVDGLGSVAYYLYGNDQSNFGQLLVESHSGKNSDGSLSLLRSISNEYVPSASGQNFPDAVGYEMEVPGGGWGQNLFQYNRPLKKSTITQQGVTFTRSVNTGCLQANAFCFDSYVRPLNVTRSSSLGYSNVDTTEYTDNDAKWVRDQVSRQTTNGIEVSKTDFDATTALPLRRYAFGKLTNSFTYNLTAGSDQAGTIATIADGKNNVTTYSGWKRGIPGTTKYPATSEKPLGATQVAVINDDGTIASITDENGYKTCYGYDAMARLSKITYPSETTVGVCDTSSWAATTISFTQGNPAAYGVPAGHWRQTTLTGNGRKILIFDALWRPLVEQTLDLANVSGTDSEVIKRYDAAGRLIFESYPMNTVGQAIWTDPTLDGTHITYDGLDRAVQVTQDSELGLLTSKTEYLNGFQTRVTDPRGNQTLTTLYQAWDQPIYDFPRGINHPEGAYTEIYRDFFGKPTALVRRNANSSVSETRRYVYNAAQELCKIIEPEVGPAAKAGSTLFHYDAAGNLDWSATGLDLPSFTSCDDTNSIVVASKVVRTYDGRNRVLTLAFPDGQGNQTWAYTPDNQPQQITTTNVAGSSAAVTNTYFYNARRLLTTERVGQTDWGYLWSLTYGYDANGHQSALTYPTGMKIDFAPNALGQPTQASDAGGAPYAWGATYYPNGAIASFSYANAIRHSLTQNVRGLPDRSRDANDAGVAVLDDSYDYDQNGNVAAISDGLNGAHSNRTMTYDGLNRLTDVVSPMYGATGAHYTYDPLDNLTHVNIGGSAARNEYYCYDTVKWLLTNIKTGSCTGATVHGLGYDTQGNLANKDGTDYKFDNGNRLRSVSYGGNVLESYRYDGLGRRVQSSSPTKGDILWQYNHDGQLLFEVNNRTGINTEYVYFGGSLVGRHERTVATNTYLNRFYHTDALGSPVAVTTGSQGVLVRNDYEPYGDTNHAPTDGPGYTGHAEDAATGLDYMQQRYYDPSIGRFLSVDPVGANGGSFNRYWYANDNPYHFTDNDGRRATVKNGQIVIQPENSAMPSVIIPNTVGASGVGPDKFSFHEYLISTPSASNNPTAVGDAFAHNPTPGPDDYASPQGTLNNVGHLPFQVLDFGVNMVRSFTVPSPDPTKFTDITVNYTVAGAHAMEEGYVLQFGLRLPSGQISNISYGEGNAFQQGNWDKSLWGPQVREVWERHHEEIDNATRGK